MFGDVQEAAADDDGSYGRCRFCGDPLPAAAAAGGPGRRREYHRKGESRDGRDCKEAARRARASAVGAAAERPLQALIAWTTTEEAARRAHVQQLRAAADREIGLAEALAELRATVLDRNTELEEQAVRDRAELTDAEARVVAAERRQRQVADEARAAVTEARADAARARERADAAEEAAVLHQKARETAERETALVEENRAELRTRLDDARRGITGLTGRLTDAERQAETARAERDARTARLEEVTAQLAEARRRLTATGAALRRATERAETAEKERAEEGRSAAERVRAAERAAERAERRWRQAEEATAADRVALEAERARAAGERSVLERELAAAHAEAAGQRERAALADRRAAAPLPPVRDVDGVPGVVVASAAVLADGQHVLLRGVSDRYTGDQAVMLARALLAVAARDRRRERGDGQVPS